MHIFFFKMHHTLCIKIEERVIQTPTRPIWYNKAPRAGRIHLTRDMTTNPKRENNSTYRAKGVNRSSCSAKTKPPKIVVGGQEEAPRPPTSATRLQRPTTTTTYANQARQPNTRSGTSIQQCQRPPGPTAHLWTALAHPQKHQRPALRKAAPHRTTNIGPLMIWLSKYVFIFTGFFIVIYSLDNFLLEDLKNGRNISEFCISERILFTEKNKLI
jgi:hypothetical protein